MENNTVEYLVSYLVSTFRNSSSQFAMVKVGKYVEVRVDVRCGDSSETPLVELNWPGIGSQGPAVAAQFAADLGKAAMVAALVSAKLGTK